MFLAGFALGDLFLSSQEWIFKVQFTESMAYFFSHIVEYALLAIPFLKLKRLIRRSKCHE